MAKSSTLAWAIEEALRRYDWADLPGFLLSFFHTFLFPAIAALLGLVVAYKISQLVWRIIFPLPARTRHLQAKKLYREGKTLQALHEWTTLSRYPTAYLSRACHEIYVMHNCVEGLAILRQAERIQLEEEDPSAKGRRRRRLPFQVPSKITQSMKLDAQAIAQGNEIMVDMNARVFKQEYLGVTSL